MFYFAKVISALEITMLKKATSLRAQQLQVQALVHELLVQLR